MSTAMQEIEKRHAKRREIMRESRLPLRVVITDRDSTKDTTTFIKKEQDELLYECFLVDHDMQCLLAALRLIEQERRLDIAGYVRRAWESARISEEELQVLNKRAMDEIEAREKEREANQKRSGDVPGQMKFSDLADTSSAEPAGPVTTRPIDTLEAK